MNRKKREEFELIIPSQIDQIRKVEDFTEKGKDVTEDLVADAKEKVEVVEDKVEELKK